MKTTFKLEKEVMTLSKAPYKTKQMAELFSFMQAAKGRHVTVNEICASFKAKGISVGTTTVYRHLEKMVQEGIVAKYVVDGTSSACFEYTGDEKPEDQLISYHCKCEKCGKLIHLHCSEVEGLQQHMMEHHGFQMDALRTVFYGICSDCQKQQNEMNT